MRLARVSTIAISSKQQAVTIPASGESLLHIGGVAAGSPSQHEAVATARRQQLSAANARLVAQK